MTLALFVTLAFFAPVAGATMANIATLRSIG